MRIFVACTHLQPVTKFCLKNYDYTPVEMDDEESYWRYFKDRWQEGNTFINIEQDIAFWPGALENLWSCPMKWCVFSYSLTGVLKVPGATPPLGLTKFSEYFIRENPDIWDEIPSRNWRNLDSGLNDWVNNTEGKTLGFHEHWPAVVNFHPELV